MALRRLGRFFSEPLNSPLAPAVPVAQQWSSFFGVYYIGNQYTSVNEPDLWAPWYFDWYGQPWKAQKVARAEMRVYNSTPEGLPGNDDAGEMSAWYVLAALGMYHTTPGVPVWALSSPAFPRMALRMGGRRLLIEAQGAGDRKPYVHGLERNGVPVTQTYLTTCQLRAGGVLRYDLGTTPDKMWGTGSDAAPPSLSQPSAGVDSCSARLAGGVA